MSLSSSSQGKGRSRTSPYYRFSLLLIAIAVFLFLLPSSFAFVNFNQSSNGLYLFYPMNAGKAGENLGYSVPNGSVTSGAVQNVSGPNSSNAYYFDGTTALSVAVNVYLKNISITFWAKNGTYALNTDRHLFGCSDEPPGQTFGIYHPSGASSVNTLSYALGGDPALGIYNFTDANWHYFVLTYNSGTQLITSYVDNALKASLTKSFPAYTADACGKARSFLAAGYTGAATGLFSVDDFGLWNRTLNSSEAAELYTLAVQNKTPFNQSSNVSNVTVMSQSFVSQNPVDVTTSNLLTQDLNITYNVQNNLDNKTIYLFHSHNSTGCVFMLNGTCSEQAFSWTNTTPSMNSTQGNYSYIFDELDVYPAVYSFPGQEGLEQQAKIDLFLNSTSQMAKWAIYNMSVTAPVTLFEAYINQTGSTQVLQLYYCNSSYTIGMASSNPNCGNFYTQQTPVVYNHSHANSFNIEANMAIVNDLIGGVKASADAYVIAQRTTSSGSWTWKYINNITRPNTAQLSTDSGASWMNVSGSLDAHIHQFYGNDSFCYLHSTDSVNTTMRCDNLDISPVPPSVVTFFSPTGGQVFSNSMLVNFSSSVAATGIIQGYNISLCNPDLTFNRSVANNSASNISFTLNTATFFDGNYTVCVDAYTNQSLVTRSYSGTFLLDNTPPFMQWTFPSRIDNSSRCVVGQNCQIEISVQDPNLYGYEINITNGAGILKYNNSMVNLTRPSYTVSDAFIPNSTGMFKVTLLASDSHTKRLIEDYDVTASSNALNFSKREKGLKVSSRSASVKYTGPYNVKNYGAKKEYDRYVFIYNLTLGTDKGKKGSQISFQASCPGMIEISDDYIAHFLCTGSDQWIDFQNPHITKYWTTSCGTDCYNIFMETDGTEDLEFRSIGGININVESAYINVTAASSDTVLDWMTCPSSVQGQMSLWFTMVMIMVMLWFCFRFGLWVIGWLVSLGGIFWSAVYGGCNNIISGFTGFFFILVCLAFLMIMIFRMQLLDFRKMMGK